MISLSSCSLKGTKYLVMYISKTGSGHSSGRGRAQVGESAIGKRR